MKGLSAPRKSVPALALYSVAFLQSWPEADKVPNFITLVKLLVPLVKYYLNITKRHTVKIYLKRTEFLASKSIKRTSFTALLIYCQHSYNN